MAKAIRALNWRRRRRSRRRPRQGEQQRDAERAAGRIEPADLLASAAGVRLLHDDQRRAYRGAAGVAFDAGAHVGNSRRRGPRLRPLGHRQPAISHRRRQHCGSPFRYAPRDRLPESRPHLRALAARQRQRRARAAARAAHAAGHAGVGPAGPHVRHVHLRRRLAQLHVRDRADALEGGVPRRARHRHRHQPVGQLPWLGAGARAHRLHLHRRARAAAHVLAVFHRRRRGGCTARFCCWGNCTAVSVAQVECVGASEHRRGRGIRRSASGHLLRTAPILCIGCALYFAMCFVLFLPLSPCTTLIFCCDCVFNFPA
mmetsp:Transcript_25571/g.59615  ORF Transcript_25571/g.59615 Transcript_25571/m.59615 type:complete len:315 (-) Transcript_25571:307-1251(-)